MELGFSFQSKGYLQKTDSYMLLVEQQYFKNGAPQLFSCCDFAVRSDRLPVRRRFSELRKFAKSLTQTRTATYPNN